MQKVKLNKAKSSVCWELLNVYIVCHSHPNNMQLFISTLNSSATFYDDFLAILFGESHFILEKTKPILNNHFYGRNVAMLAQSWRRLLHCNALCARILRLLSCHVSCGIQKELIPKSLFVSFLIKPSSIGTHHYVKLNYVTKAQGLWKNSLQITFRRTGACFALEHRLKANILVPVRVLRERHCSTRLPILVRYLSYHPKWVRMCVKKWWCVTLLCHNLDLNWKRVIDLG